jgi:hypothetical protein
MRIDERLNLIIPIPRDGGTVYIHSMPLSREAFESQWLMLSKTFAVLMAEGLSVVAGPRIAFMALKDISTKADRWDGPQGVRNTVINEIIRLSNLVSPEGDGWKTTPLQSAIEHKMFSDDELSEVLGTICFFTLNTAIHRKDTLRVVLTNMNDLWGTLTSLSPLTEFVASLPKLTKPENIGTTAPIASVPH